jgi:hypothetical protein
LSTFFQLLFYLLFKLLYQISTNIFVHDFSLVTPPIIQHCQNNKNSPIMHKAY